MYRCQQCNTQQGPGVSQMKIVTKKRHLFKNEKDNRGNEKKIPCGWEIEEEKIVCYSCYNKLIEKEAKERERKKEQRKKRRTKAKNKEAVNGGTEAPSTAREETLRNQNQEHIE